MSSDKQEKGGVEVLAGSLSPLSFKGSRIVAGQHGQGGICLPKAPPRKCYIEEEVACGYWAMIGWAIMDLGHCLGCPLPNSILFVSLFSVKESWWDEGPCLPLWKSEPAFPLLTGYIICFSPSL